MTSYAGRRMPGQTVRLRKEPLRLPLWLLVPWWLVKLLWRLVRG